MGRINMVRVIVAVAALGMVLVGRVEAQVGYPYQAPYGYQIRNGQIGPGYQAAYGLHQRAYMTAAPMTVTNYQPMINAITSIPGWYGPPAAGPMSHQERPKPLVAREELIGADGTVRWPSAAPDGPARKAAEGAVKAVVEEHDKYGQATVRHVADARNKLTQFARETLPGLKARNPADAAGLERFIVELQKTLATLAVNY